MVRTKVFFAFEVLPYSPLTVENVSKCLKEFIQSLKEAITEFHEAGFAHLDIRLENVCFNGQCEAVLIDLDRAQPRACNATELPNYDSAMYTPTGADWKVDKLDWMQLGFLIKFVLTHTY